MAGLYHVSVNVAGENPRISAEYEQTATFIAQALNDAGFEADVHEELPE